MAVNLDELQFFAVRSKEGKWFRAKGYGGYGDTWVDELKRARVYNRIGPARATVSYFANTFPKYGIPDLVMFKCTEMVVLDETVRVKKQKQAKDLAKKKQELQHRQHRYDEAKTNLEKAKKEMKEIEETGLE